MALVELQPKTYSGARLGSIESRCDPASEPAPASRRPAAPEREPKPQIASAWASGPLASLVAKGAGISLLMLGLGGIGAYAMAHGLHPQVALAEPAAARTASRGPATHAAMGAATALAAPSAAPPDTTTPNAPPTEAVPKPPSGLTSDGRVILNLASLEDLRKLPGVGPKRAEAILALRQKLGKFKHLTDLLRIRGIGPKRLKQLQPRLLLDAPAEPPSPPKPPVEAAPVPKAS
jgi:competence protein ComEA